MKWLPKVVVLIVPGSITLCIWGRSQLRHLHIWLENLQVLLIGHCWTPCQDELVEFQIYIHTSRAQKTLHISLVGIFKNKHHECTNQQKQAANDKVHTKL